MSDGPIPGGTIGVVGGGQLGRMLAEAAGPLGVTIDILDPTPHCPAAPFARNHLVAPFDDVDATEAVASRVDVLTYEIELADPDALAAVQETTGTPVHPHPDTLRMIQDKLRQNEALQDAGIPVPPFAAVDSAEAVRDVCAELGYPAMLKARRGGYDGRGNLPINGPAEVEEALAEVGTDAMIESFVDFEREISVIAVKGVDEEASYVPVENIHEAEILRETVVPARTSDDRLQRAQEVADEVLAVLDGRGVYGIELFEQPDGQIVVNEIAPRPHNSGHWTIEGAVTSQFEQHIRAILGHPLGSTDHRGATVTANLLGQGDHTGSVQVSGISELLAARDIHLHWYGKRESRPLRKMGHLTVTGPHVDDRGDLLATARGHAEQVSITPGG